MKKNGFAPILVILIVLVIAGAAYYFGTLKNKPNLALDIPTTTPAVSAQPPNPTVKPTADPTANWKTFSTYAAQFPISFKYPPNLNVVGRNYSGSSYHIFISYNPISIPDMWDSPITPVEIDYPFNNQRSYQTIINDAVSNLIPDSLQKTEPNVSGIRMTKISGTTAEGYLGGEKITTIVVDYSKGPILITHFNSLFKDQPQITDTTLDQILSTFKYTQ